MPEDTQKPVSETPASAQAVEQKTPETEKVKDGLPEEVSERTRGEFEKLQTQLREERQARERVESAYTTLIQPKKEEPKEVPIYDPETGMINPDELTKLQKEAQQARIDAQTAREEFTNYKQQGEYAKAYQKYEWTNPQSKNFDEKRSNLAAAIALASMVEPDRYGGKQLDLEGAASFVEGLTSGQVEQVKADAAKQAIEQLSPKEQAALEATGSSGRREEESPLDFDDVKVATRKGGNEGIVATMARLRELKKNQEAPA
jgi:hypothetical protein